MSIEYVYLLKNIAPPLWQRTKAISETKRHGL